MEAHAIPCVVVNVANSDPIAVVRLRVLFEWLDIPIFDEDHR